MAALEFSSLREFSLVDGSALLLLSLFKRVSLRQKSEMKMVSPAIENAHTITQVVEIVNAANRGEAILYFGGTELRDGDQLAGHYAYDAAKSGGAGMEEADFDAHLECLNDAGAVFDFPKALAEAFRLKKQCFE